MQAQAKNLAKDEFNVNDLLQTLWIGKWIIVAFAIVGTAIAIAAALLISKKYEAITVVAPAPTATGTGQMGGLGGLASQFGGLASLAGISVGGDSRQFESIAVLQSEALTERYIQENNLLPILYQNLWDPKKLQWTTTNPKKIPTLWKANQFFKKKIRTITTDPKTGMVALTIVWKDPVLAARWANGLVKLTNDYLRTKTIEESERHIAYLTEEASKTNVIEARQAMFSILQTEINKVMLARGSEEYAFKVVDPAAIPELPKSPQPLLWTIIGTFTGLLTGVFLVIMRSSWGSPLAAADTKNLEFAGAASIEN